MEPPSVATTIDHFGVLALDGQDGPDDEVPSFPSRQHSTASPQQPQQQQQHWDYGYGHYDYGQAQQQMYYQQQQYQQQQQYMAQSHQGGQGKEDDTRYYQQAYPSPAYHGYSPMYMPQTHQAQAAQDSQQPQQQGQQGQNQQGQNQQGQQGHHYGYPPGYYQGYYPPNPYYRQQQYYMQQQQYYMHGHPHMAPHYMPPQEQKELETPVVMKSHEEEKRGAATDSTQQEKPPKQQPPKKQPKPSEEPPKQETSPQSKQRSESAESKKKSKRNGSKKPKDTSSPTETASVKKEVEKESTGAPASYKSAIASAGTKKPSAPATKPSDVDAQLRAQVAQQSQKAEKARAVVATGSAAASTSTRAKGKVNFESEEWRSQLHVPQADQRHRTADVTSTRGVQWDSFGLSRELMAGIFEMGFEVPSPIQEVAIPPALEGKHVLARAKNGTGKTGAFVVPVLHAVELSRHEVQVVVLVPTRELAFQTSNTIKRMGKYLGHSQAKQHKHKKSGRRGGLECVVLTGGQSVRDDVIRLKAGPHVVVATIGRLLDLVEQKAADLSHTKLVVMDEADKLLSSQWTPLIEKVLRYTPQERQIMALSATFPNSVRGFQQKWLPADRCATVSTMQSLTLEGVTQYYAFVQEKQKLQCLKTLFAKLEIQQCIVFCNSVHRTELLAQKIIDLGLSCFFIHSKMPQRDRNRVFHEFRQGKCRVLVCTDLLTRGIDVQTVNVVINFDMPVHAETYLHRIGRSGRYGHLGLAINLVTQKDRDHLFRIEGKLGARIEAIPQQVDRSIYAV
ncbi:MAG: hypothetical protein MHM6MM_001168 [Cercozoa sp. M6MM]